MGSGTTLVTVLAHKGRFVLSCEDGQRGGVVVVGVVQIVCFVLVLSPPPPSLLLFGKTRVLGGTLWKSEHAVTTLGE